MEQIDKDTVNLKQPGTYRGKTGFMSLSLGTSRGDFKEMKENSFKMLNWCVQRMNVKDAATAIIEESGIDDLTVRGFCFIKNCRVNHIRVGMLGNLFLMEGNCVETLEIDGTLNSISSASSVRNIKLHRGGRALLLTTDHFGGHPKQPDNLCLDANRTWCYKTVITYDERSSMPGTMEYWAFG